MWFYIGHLNGNIYATDEQQDFADLYCEVCGDSDWEIACATNHYELISISSEEIQNG